MLLVPRDYLSSFLKIGTVILLIVAVFVANPVLPSPMVSLAYALIAAGLAVAAIAAYPELGNTGKPIEVLTYWGITEHVLGVIGYRARQEPLLRALLHRAAHIKLCVPRGNLEQARWLWFEYDTPHAPVIRQLEESAFPGRPRGKRCDFGQGNTWMVSNPALGRYAMQLVRNASSSEKLDRPIVHVNREVYDENALDLP